MRGYRNFLITFFSSFFLICLAELLEGLRAFITLGYLSDLTEIVVFLFFFGLISFWAVSIRSRVMRDNLRRFLIAAAGVMVFWMVLRAARYSYAFIRHPVFDLLWYAYYIPIILLPLIGFYVALCLGMPSDRNPRAPWFLLVPAAAVLIVMVMTNGVHYGVFRFVTADQIPHGAYTDADGNYIYAAGFFVIVAWVLSLELSSILLIIHKSRSSASRGRAVLPILVLGVSIVYWLLYWRFPSRHGVGFIELPVGLSWFSVMIWESCIRIGLIPVNTRYQDFFNHATLKLQITDPEGEPYLSSYGALTIPNASFRQLRDNGTLILDEETEAHIYPISCGYSVWQEEVGALNDMLAELRLNARELREGNTIAQREYAARKKRDRIREETRLYSLISDSLQESFDDLRADLDALDRQTDPVVRRALLARINLKGVFLKRRGNAVMMAEGGERFTVEELRLCFAELAENGALCGLAFSYTISLSQEPTYSAVDRLYSFLRDLFTATDGLSRCFLLLTDAGGSIRAKAACSPSEPEGVHALYEELCAGVPGTLPVEKDEEEGSVTVILILGEEDDAA